MDLPPPPQNTDATHHSLSVFLLPSAQGCSGVGHQGTGNGERLSLYIEALNVEKVKMLLDSIQKPLINSRDERGRTLLQLLILQFKLDCAQVIFEAALEWDVRVDLSFDRTDVLEWSLKDGSQDVVRFILENLSRGVATSEATAKILRHLPDVVGSFPRLAEEYLKNDKFVFTYGRFSAPLSLFKKEFRLGILGWSIPIHALNRDVSKPVIFLADEVPNLDAITDWQAKNICATNHKGFSEAMTNNMGAQVIVESKFVCIDGFAAKNNNFLFARLLSPIVAVDIFKSEAIAKFLEWKWKSAWRYVYFMLIVFPVYVNAAICSYLALEMKKIANEDNIKHYYRFRSYPNLVDWSRFDPPHVSVTKEKIWHSIVPLLVLQLLSLFGKKELIFRFCVTLVLSALILKQMDKLGTEDGIETIVQLSSVQCVLLYIEILFVTRPVNFCGPMIAMITSVFRDIVEFAIIGTVIILGFGFVLFAIASVTNEYGPGWQIDDNSLIKRDVEASAKVFEYLFYAVIGEFETEAFIGWQDNSDPGHSDNPGLHIAKAITFDAFMFIGHAVLLSLLISVLGDTFDREKLHQKAKLIKCQLRTMLGLENSWGTKIWNKIKFATQIDKFANSPKGKYFHYLVPVEPVTSTEENIWQGKLVATMKHMNKLMEKQETKIESRLTATMEHMNKLTEESETKIESRLTSLKDEISQVHQINVQLRDSVNSMRQEISMLCARVEDPSN